MSNFRRLVNILKSHFSEYKVSVRRCKMPNGEFGDCDKKGRNFIVRIDKFRSEDEQIFTLIHEFAHVPAWDDREDHGKKWGKAYAECYNIYEQFIDDLNENL